jgi:hypothetical protein
MELNQAGQDETIARAKKYAALARHAQERGEHRRAALLYMVAATLLDTGIPPLPPLTARTLRGERSKIDT